MSASLVGSEMCIRDSSGGLSGIVLSTSPELPGSSSKVSGALRKLPGAPVSYTHLTLPTICSV
eukprot:12044561-Alexandrium_andersonii.AAC.1